MEGMRESLKSKQKRTKRGRSSQSVRSLCGKICETVIFQTANRVLSVSPAYKGVSLLKKSRHLFSFSFSLFLLTCKYFHCRCIFDRVNTLIFYVEFAKKFFTFSLFTPQFFIRKFISIAELFFRGGMG